MCRIRRGCGLRRWTPARHALAWGRGITCREFTEFLHDYLFDDLPAEERLTFETHLAECPCCVAYLDSYRKTMQLAQAALFIPEDAPPPVEAPEELIQAILRARPRPS